MTSIREGKQFSSVFSSKARELRQGELRTVGGGLKGNSGVDNQGRCINSYPQPGFGFCN